MVLQTKSAGHERIWMSIQTNKTTTGQKDPGLLFMCLVYMPVDDGSKVNTMKYKDILEVLSLDIKLLQDNKQDYIIYGDFNAHVGDEKSSQGIPGNTTSVKPNGRILTDWLNLKDLTLVNSQPCTDGIWTFRGPKGERSALDFMIVPNHTTYIISHLIIDEENILSGHVNADHSILVSTLQTNFNRVTWPKACNKTWIRNLSPEKEEIFRSTLASEADSISTNSKSPNNKDPNALDSDIAHLVKSATKKSSKSRARKALRPLVREMNDKITDIFIKINKIQKSVSNPRLLSHDAQQTLRDLNRSLTEVKHSKFELLKSVHNESTAKSRRILRARGCNSKQFWDEISDHVSKEINSLLTKTGKQSRTPDETKETAHEHFQELKRDLMSQLISCQRTCHTNPRKL